MLPKKTHPIGGVLYAGSPERWNSQRPERSFPAEHQQVESYDVTKIVKLLVDIIGLHVQAVGRVSSIYIAI